MGVVPEVVGLRRGTLYPEAVFHPDPEMRAKPAWGRGGKVALLVGAGTGVRESLPIVPLPQVSDPP